MEDDGGVKAPVTRLRRRLSVEHSDDGKTSSAPSTPTKKRGGRKPAKPELDLIDENAPVNDTLKKTKMKELDMEEKPVTPSRRSTRIKSNTSIILEATQVADSPRAKRASRRNSQIGSDNETPLTPVKLTRRTRKDSTTDKAESVPVNKPVVQTPEIIIEEPESSTQKLPNNSEKPTEPRPLSSLRKSPRLSLKKNKRSESANVDIMENIENEKINKNNISEEVSNKETHQSEKHNNSNIENKETSKNMAPVIKLVNISSNLITEENIKLSVSNQELLDKLNTEPIKKNRNINKSSSALTDTHNQNFKRKRHRTKSWTTLSDSTRNDNQCFSDSESLTKKKNLLNSINYSVSNNISKTVKDNLNLPSNHNITEVLDISLKGVETDLVISTNNKEKIASETHGSLNSTIKLFAKEPSTDMKTLVYIEESDSNSEVMSTQKQVEDENQNLSTVQNHSDNQERPPEKEKIQSDLNLNQSSDEKFDLIKNNSCEPMDIDETLPDNNTPSNKSLSAIADKSENKVSLNVNDKMNYSLNEVDKFKESSTTFSTSQTIDNTVNENKSTLVLSQLKDISTENNLSQSPYIATENKLSNFNQVLNFTQDNEVDKKNLSLNCLTSTPLQQKSLIKQAIQVNTPIIDSNNTSKIDKSDSKINMSNTNKFNNKSGNSESDGESSQEERNFIDDEAEEASENYESGDSRDDEEKEYEKQHEIKDKGQTLTSEHELSCDTDDEYEKDSFVVSSDEEDNDLLDGSGDDISMSDNQLKMTAESKKKYNERKIKEQKEASKEMFVSRHKLNISNKNNKLGFTKPKKNRAISDSDSEDETIHFKVKKNNRMRLDSSHETSMNKSSDNISKSLSQSVHDESDTKESEMTIVEEQKQGDTDPLLIDIKKEPKTPNTESINSSIQFVDPEQPEKETVNINNSHLNMTLADDPLEESNASESSDSSNNIHVKNYDSILNVLNKNMPSKKNKKGDTSLNIDKKVKQKSAPIVDQLNLTQLKTKRKEQNEVTLKNSKKSLHDKSKKESINNCDNDLHLLFSEDDNNSEDVEVTEKMIEQSNDGDDFIPLKKPHDKSYNTETSESNNKSLTQSAKKMKKKGKALDKSNIDDSERLDVNADSGSPREVSNKDLKETREQQTHDEEVNSSVLAPSNKSMTKTPKSDKKKKKISESQRNEQTDDEKEVQFFVDKTGTHSPASVEKSINMSDSKKKKEKSMSSVPKDSDSDAPMELSNKNYIETQMQQIDAEKDINTSLAANKSITKTPNSSKKKKRMSESQTKEQIDASGNHSDIEDNIGTMINQSGLKDTSMNKSVSKTPKSDKKKKKRLSESQTEDKRDVNSDSDSPREVSNKDLKETREQQTHDEEVNSSVLAPSNKSMTKTPKSDKKKKKILESQRNEQTDIAEAQPVMDDDIEAKINDTDVATASINKSMSKTPKSEKKKAKRMSESVSAEEKDDKVATEEHTPRHAVTGNKSAIEEHNTLVAGDNIINKSAIKPPKSDKKKKKLLESQPETQAASPINTTMSTTSSSEKKKIKKLSESNDANNTGNVDESTEADSSKKRKRKSSLSQTEKEPQPEGLVPCPISEPNTSVPNAIISQNKKRKVSHTIENSDNHDQDESLNNKKGTKKRKQREDDAEIQVAKMLKPDTKDKIQVPRLPARILDQLEDRPTKSRTSVTKPKAISTSNFVVEVAKVKKTKPSNYLEESIYLNEEEILESKKQRYIQNPKVLPFLPTVSTSSSGYTTNFKVNVLHNEVKFVAKSANVSNYKNDYLQNKKIKRLGTYELYKRNRTIKMSKF